MSTNENSAPRRTTAVGVFRDRSNLELALARLRDAGYDDEQVAVTMRGLRVGDAPGPANSDEVQKATVSILTVRAGDRPDETEEILRQCGAEDIHWSSSLTAGVAGSTAEIVDSES